jgi:hypothetical protein
MHPEDENGGASAARGDGAGNGRRRRGDAQLLAPRRRAPDGDPVGITGHAHTLTEAHAKIEASGSASTCGCRSRRALHRLRD